MTLTATEKEKGWVIWTCPEHGDLLAGPLVGMSVRCRCRRQAHPSRGGKRLHREQIRRIKASQATP